MNTYSNASTNRRRLFGAIPAFSFGALVDAGASSAKTKGESDPILPLFREWVAARKEWYRHADPPGNGNWDMPESKAAEARENAAFRAVLEMTPTSMAGIAALATVMWDLNEAVDGSHCEGLAETVEQQNEKLIAAIYRAASGRNEIPFWDNTEALA
ncbi:hypothetical protein [Pseudogemmobacter sonorensis]|uniref:hypothetical protein n=1 Tax=Pseudogemmobacter sonorensis TaxID=2989681 RepID=UPI0036A21B42